MGVETIKSWNPHGHSSSGFNFKFRQAKFIGTFVVGVGTILAIIGLVVVYVIVPAANLGRVKRHLNLNDSNSVGRRTFEFPKGTSFNRFFFFRLDHSCEIVNGDKPEVVQRGPYTFQSQKERVNFQYHAESDTLSYETITRYKFDPERSCEVCQSTDRMIFINIPLITLIYLGRTHRMFPQHFLHDLNNAIQLKGSHPDSVVTFMQVDKFLFHGWNPPCLRWFRESYSDLWQYLPERFYPEGFALQKSSNVSDFYTIKGGLKNIEEMFHIQQWGPDPNDMFGDLTPVRWWTPNGGFEGSNACNWLRGTDGFQFAPLITKDQPLWMFHRELCRSIELIPVQGDEMVQGVPVTRYVISENSLLFNTKRNLGFCMEAEAGTNWSACVKASPRSERLDVEECLLDPQYHGYCHKAVWDITSCMDGVPLALSLPHFYQAPTGLRTSVKGLSSSYPPFHETRIKVEPNTGMVVQYQKRLQFNLHLESDTNISQMEHIRKVLLPLFWYEESYEMDDMTLNLIKSDVLAPNKVLQIVQWFVVALGVGIVLLGIAHFWLCRSREKA
ncbi:lysosome membrane protein 2-like [Tigriopus californicus]|uniref:lysosome membrane protein 2-like n=1 Tax=Tigriopus californicus TaxID=6832 RepID=UPI0027D9E222|nr:lysosome membrane protein 2-like [Tigriopus californicus]